MSSKLQKGFTLIELLVVIAVLGIMAAIVMIAIDPGTQLARARDAQRKADVRTIANALEQYYTINLAYPAKTPNCELSTGSNAGDSDTDWGKCSNVSGYTPGTDWDQNSNIYKGLVEGKYLKDLPVDPKNNSDYFYRYNPESSNQYFLIVTKLEKPTDPSKPYFRCANNPSRFIGCKEFAQVYSSQ